MQVLQENSFARAYKKLHPEEQEKMKQEIRKIISNPLQNPKKKGALARLRVHKYQYNNQLKLLGYLYEKKTITLMKYGSHENFYSDIR